VLLLLLSLAPEESWNAHGRSMLQHIVVCAWFVCRFFVFSFSLHIYTPAE
jgi:hypothetical protein